MKLKKIASLALAGVMAVSMLAGCAGNNNNSSSNNTNDDDVVVVPTSAVVDIFNKGQDVAAKAQVEFTADSSFEKKVVAAVEELGTSNITTSNTTLLANLKLQTGLTTVAVVNGSTTLNTAGFLDDSVRGDAAAEHDGEVNSFIGATVISGSASIASPEAAAKSAFANVKAFIDTLPASSKSAADTHPGDDYLTYTYTGNVCAVAANTTTGAPVYVVAYVINQNVALETAPEV